MSAGGRMKVAYRRVGKWALWALALLLVLFALYASVFFFPYPMFPYHAEMAGFSVYSDGEIPGDFEIVAKDARLRIEAMELYDGGADLRIFVCRSRRLFVFLNKWAGKRYAGQALVISVAGNAFFSETGIQSVGRRTGGRPEHSRLQGSWAAAIAHEAAHDLMISELGFQNARKIPVWKSEGYADYSANLSSARSDPDYDFHGRVALLLDDEFWDHSLGEVDRRHFRWHVLVEYLCVVKGLTFEELLDEGVTEENAREELMTRYSNYPSTESDVPKTQN